MSSVGYAELQLRRALYDLACGERGAWNRVGAEGLIERARSMSPSVNTSAANLGKVVSIATDHGIFVNQHNSYLRTV